MVMTKKIEAIQIKTDKETLAVLKTFCLPSKFEAYQKANGDWKIYVETLESSKVCKGDYKAHVGEWITKIQGIPNCSVGIANGL